MKFAIRSSGFLRGFGLASLLVGLAVALVGGLVAGLPLLIPGLGIVASSFFILVRVWDERQQREVLNGFARRLGQKAARNARPAELTEEEESIHG